MTGNAINAKSEVPAARSQALELHELSSEELGAVSGGSLSGGGGTVSGGAVHRFDISKSAAEVKAFQEALR